MKEAIGGSYLFILVIVMVAVFTSYVSLATNYARCYKIKDEIINTIEAEGGVSKEAIKKINLYLKNIGYRSSAPDCRDMSDKHFKYAGTTTLKFSIDNDNGNVTGMDANYCISKTPTSGRTVYTGHPKKSGYYTVTVFFQLSLPVFGNMFLIPLSGETATLVGMDKEGLWSD